MAESPLRSLFRRGNAATEAEPETVVVPDVPPEQPEPVGKGRPTPKRREAEQRRRRVVQAPTTRKEAARLRRDQARQTRLDQRSARTRGGERPLPPRDAGPARAFVRDYVDSRRGPGTYFLPATLVIFILGFSGIPALALVGNAMLLTMIVMVILNSRQLGRAVIREVEKRFPGESTRGLKWYAVTRSLQLRRMRIPKARVNTGDPV